MDKWEYRSLTKRIWGWAGVKLDTEEFDDELNELGADGWELVSCFTATGGYGKTREVVAVFKRRKK
ncbi:MAG: DUF4177 domain-containing protein [Spirochaetota bacterium]|nr:MAG: DUF4177 domain-containing protein [Spirochaetota bacterium]